MYMKNDRKIVISTGTSRKATTWRKNELNFSDFVERVKSPIRSTESYAEYLKLPKAQQDELKDVGGFVGGELIGTRRKAQNVLKRDLVTLDFDNIPAGVTEEIIEKVKEFGYSYVIYSTRKHSPDSPRLRIIFPLARSVGPDEYEPIARKLAELIGIQMADPTTFEASRLMYWPSCSKDSEFAFSFGDYPMVGPEDILSKYDNWRDIKEWPRQNDEDLKQRRLATKQENPLDKKGLIGAFCKAYNIYQAIEKFIPKAYDPTGEEDRLTYMGGSTSGGAIVYQDGLFLYSHHATDPCGGQLVNSWDLVRLHKFGDLDEDAKENTPVSKLPSSLAMKDLALKDSEVKAILAKERQEEASNYFDEEIIADDNWQGLLDLNSNGSYSKTIANIVTILNHDPNFKGKIYADEFANRGMVDLPLPWEDGEGSRMWSDVDDAQLTLRLEKEYGITGKQNIENAIKVVGFDNRRNEVKDYLDSLDWDGQKRIDYLLRDYLGAEQSIYSKEIIRKALVAAIARATSSEGVKFDTMVVFKGPQGIGKSTFLSKLGGKWFNDSLYSFEGKEAAELIQGTLIVEVGELSAMTKSETEVVKQFLSKTHDIYREAYGKRTNKYPRRCVFFGSTNSDQFLKDATGNRRFWPIEVGVERPRKSIFEDLTEEVVGQIWAEAYVYYLIGEKLILSEEAELIAKEMQDQYREVDPKEGAIKEFLSKKIPENWYDLDLQTQKAFYNGSFKAGEDLKLVERDKVCIAEIWQVLMGGDLKYLRRRESLELTNIMTGISGWERNKSQKRYGNFGRQRGFERSKVINISDLSDKNSVN